MSDDLQVQDDAAAARFPFINLEKALARAQKLFDQAGDHEMTSADAFQCLGYSPKSSGGFQTIGALRAYKLLSGLRGSDRLTLTPTARNYFRDERPEAKARLVREFAIAPQLLGALLIKWGPVPPADHIARSHLKIDRGLSEQNARTVLGIFKENVAFAKLTSENMGDGKGSVAEQANRGNDVEPPDPPPLPPILPKRGVSLMDGERELTTGMLSRDANFRLIVSGPVGVKEIDLLIRKLELDKEILADEEPNEPPQ